MQVQGVPELNVNKIIVLTIMRKFKNKIFHKV